MAGAPSVSESVGATLPLIVVATASALAGAFGAHARVVTV